MSHLTGAELAVLGTVAGAGIGFAGTAFVNWRQDKRARAADRARAIELTLAAADDLLDAVRLFRAAGGAITMLSWLGAGALQSVNDVPSLPDGRSLSRPEKLVMAVYGLVSAMAPGGTGSQFLDGASAKYLAMVTPPRQRLSAAVASLRLAPDRDLASAADRLSRAGGKLADEGSSLPRAFRRAEKAFEKAVRTFHVTAQRQRRR